MQMSDSEFARLYDHINSDELGHPDEEYTLFGFEGRLSCELFHEALVCERDRRTAVVEAARLTQTNNSDTPMATEEPEGKIFELQ